LIINLKKKRKISLDLWTDFKNRSVKKIEKKRKRNVII